MTFAAKPIRATPSNDSFAICSRARTGVNFQDFAPHFASFKVNFEDFTLYLASFTVNFEVLRLYFASFTLYLEDFTLYLASFTLYLGSFAADFGDFTVYLGRLALRAEDLRARKAGSVRSPTVREGSIAPGCPPLRSGF